MTRLSSEQFDRLSKALKAARYSYCGGGTHGFYHYPARFSPEIARTVIALFSQPGDLVLDPFMGGGTSIIEGLSLGRQMVGVDINALAHFVTSVRTTPLSLNDEEAVRAWATEVTEDVPYPTLDVDQPGAIVNLPRSVQSFLAGAIERVGYLPLPRQRAFARCVLLRLGQWALDCRDFTAPRQTRLAARLLELTEEMFAGMRAFVESCREVGVPKNGISARRLLIHGNAVNSQTLPALERLTEPVSLVLTSPPYPSVHVLYHRWQYRGRRETSAPYWIANVPDGYAASHYTGGSRTPTGRKRYFHMIEEAFSSVRSLLDPDALVVQLVGFADARSQLPRYLAAMDRAGFDEVDLLSRESRLVRRVPNRKWYAKLKGAVDASRELLLFHAPRV